MQNCVAPASRVAPCGGEDLVEVEERVNVDTRVVPDRLRAERAVFGARARLGVDQAFELDLGSAPREANFVGERDERRKLVEGKLRDGEGLVARESAALVEERTLSSGERHVRDPIVRCVV